MYNIEDRNKLEQEVLENTVLHFQPIMNISNEKVIMIEVLTRKVDKDGNIVSAVDLMEELKKHDMFKVLDDKVLDEVYTLISNPKNNSFFMEKEIMITVNISKNCLDELARIYKVNGETGFERFYNKNIVIEVSEDQDLNEDIVDLLIEIENNGVLVAIDDVGTGIQKIQNLKEQSINYVKLDISLLPNPNEEYDELDLQMFKAIMNLFKTMNKIIVVEGVEVPEQHAFLKSFDDSLLVQGWNYSKAIDLDSVIKFIEKRN